MSVYSWDHTFIEGKWVNTGCAYNLANSKANQSLGRSVSKVFLCVLCGGCAHLNLNTVRLRSFQGRKRTRRERCWCFGVAFPSQLWKSTSWKWHRSNINHHAWILAEQCALIFDTSNVAKKLSRAMLCYDSITLDAVERRRNGHLAWWRRLNCYLILNIA